MRRWLVVGAWLGAGVALRVATCFYHDLSGDDATVALMAKHVLAGETFPVFFYRQTFIGSVTGLHLVPALFVFGPSVWLVRLHEIAWGLLFLLGLYLLGRRLFGEPAARAALALGAVSPFLLTYWSSVAEPHFAANTFGVVLLLLAVTALRTAPGPRYTRILLVFGLTAGLACWQAFKAIEIVGPALLVLVWRDPRLPLRAAGAALAGGLALGSLPAWLFYAARGDAPGYAQRLFAAGIEPSLDRAVTMVATVVPTLVGTYYWPPATPARQAALVAVLAVHAAAVALLAAGARTREHRLLLLVLIVPFGLLYASRYVATFDHETARYVLPVYIPLLLAAGALVARVGARARPAGAALLAGLLAFHLWTNAAFLWPLDAAERARRERVIGRRAAVARHLATHPVEALYVDDGGESLRWAFLWGRAAVSELTSEIYLPQALAADAAHRVAILTITRDPSVAAQLQTAGATFRTTPFERAVLLDDIRAPARAWRPVPRGAWRVAGERPDAPGLADGDLGTASPGGGPAAGHAAVSVDLGAAYAVARVTWWPSTDWENSVALAVARSADGETWEPLGTLPSPTPARRPTFIAGGRPFFRSRNGWLELRAVPRLARYLRFAPLDPAGAGDWGIAELAVYEDAGPVDAGEPDPESVVAGLRARGLGRLLADAATSSRVARASRGTIRTRIANGVLDSHGRGLPPARLWAPVDLRPTDGLLVPREDAEELRGRLAGAGLRVRAEAVGDALLVHGLPVGPRPPCRPTRWRVVTTGLVAPDGGVAPSLVEASIEDPAPVAGAWVEHPLVGARDVRVLAVAVSEDGRTWRPVPDPRRVPDWAWAGRTLFAQSGGVDELVWSAAPARAARLELAIPDVDGRSPITRMCLRAAPR